MPGDATSSGLFAYSGGRPFAADRPCIAFIHGAQHDHSVWALQSRYLAHHGYSVLAFDLPGHGRSAGPPAPSVESAADAVAAALEARIDASTPLLLVGHSMGSLIALEVARRRPASAAGLALLAAAFPMRVSEQLLEATRTAPDEAMHMINVWSHRPSIGAFSVKPGSPGPGFDIVWQNLRLMQQTAARHGPAVLPNDFAACNAYAGGIDAARALSCPVLFILGEVDQMVPPKASRALIEACARASVTTLRAAGHALMTEDPEGVRSALYAFAQRVLAAGEARQT